MYPHNLSPLQALQMITDIPPTFRGESDRLGPGLNVLDQYLAEMRTRLRSEYEKRLASYIVRRLKEEGIDVAFTEDVLPDDPKFRAFCEAHILKYTGTEDGEFQLFYHEPSRITKYDYVLKVPITVAPAKYIFLFSYSERMKFETREAPGGGTVAKLTIG